MSPLSGITPLSTRQLSPTGASIPKPGLSPTAFRALVWSGCAFSLLSVILRLVSRIRTSRRIYIDDGLIIFAQVLVIVTAGLWQWCVPYMYYVLDVGSGAEMPGPELLPSLEHWLNVQFIVQLFFYTTLLLVKLSFLFFFRRLSRNVQGQKYIWWSVLAFSLAVYFISVGDIQYKCYFSSLMTVLSWCTSKEANQFTMATMRANMALDVVSDFMIILIPVTMLWNVRLPIRKKLAFMGLFSLGLITIVVSIVRTVNVYETTQHSSGGSPNQNNTVFLWMWSAVQASLAVMVSCLSAFPQLFAAASSAKKPVWTPTDTYYQRLKNRMGKSSHKSHSYGLTGLTMDEETAVDSTVERKESPQIPAHKDFDNSSSSSDTQYSPALDSRVSVDSLQIPEAVYNASGPPAGIPTPGTNGIVQQFEYRVQRQSRPYQRMDEKDAYSDAYQNTWHVSKN